MNKYTSISGGKCLKGRGWVCVSHSLQSSAECYGKAWIAVLSGTGRGKKWRGGLLSSYYESDNRFRLKIYHHLWLSPQPWLLYAFKHWILRLKKAKLCTHTAKLLRGSLALCLWFSHLPVEWLGCPADSVLSSTIYTLAWAIFFFTISELHFLFNKME